MHVVGNSPAIRKAHVGWVSYSYACARPDRSANVARNEVAFGVLNPDFWQLHAHDGVPCLVFCLDI